MPSVRSRAAGDWTSRRPSAMAAVERGSQRGPATLRGCLSPAQRADVEWATQLHLKTGTHYVVHGVQVGWEFRNAAVGCQQQQEQHNDQQAAPQQEVEVTQLDAGSQPQPTQRQLRRKRRSFHRSGEHHAWLKLWKMRGLVIRAMKRFRHARVWAVRNEWLATLPPASPAA